GGAGGAAISSNDTNGNNVEQQVLKIFGPESSVESSVTIPINSSAKVIADKINVVSVDTGVNALATTTATISGITTAGIVSFKLAGTNTTAGNETPVSALVGANDLTSLAQAINDQAGNTGINATISGDKTAITLTQANGYDIKISTYTHSDATETMVVEGNEDATPTARTLTTAAANSTTIGGEVSFYSNGSFNVSSSVDAAGGSLFSTGVSAANGSDLQSIDDVDISTVEGASDAIRSIDGAVGQIDRMRGNLGALQNRFESTIANLQNVSENLSAARSRILDADIAQETSAMTKNNILQQAGV
ncbi:MAG: hypothetical protein JZU65_20385, partial [Chlorobium sp.]|nr:hypothetical protein [Chlorobium sp.]